MKKVWVAAAGLAALSATAPASAADMAVAAPERPYAARPAYVPPPFYDWTGFYIGANGGWAQSHACLNEVLAGTTFVDGCRDVSGGIVGGQVGYRWQMGGWVFGVEGQGDWADLTGSRVSVLNPLVSERTKVDALGLFTGQIGYAWNAAMVYLKGGAAVTGSRLDIYSTVTGAALASTTFSRAGGSVGVAFEYGFTPNWSVGVEYDHMFLGRATNTFVVNPIIAGASSEIRQDVDMVALRVNYRFGDSYGAKYW